MMPTSRFGAIESTTVERSAVSMSASDVMNSLLNGVLNWPTWTPRFSVLYGTYASCRETLAFPVPTDPVRNSPCTRHVTWLAMLPCPVSRAVDRAHEPDAVPVGFAGLQVATPANAGARRRGRGWPWRGRLRGDCCGRDRIAEHKSQ